MYTTTLPVSRFQIQHKFWDVYVTRILIMVQIMMHCIINSPWLLIQICVFTGQCSFEKKCILCDTQFSIRYTSYLECTLTQCSIEYIRRSVTYIYFLSFPALDLWRHVTLEWCEQFPCELTFWWILLFSQTINTVSFWYALIYSPLRGFFKLRTPRHILLVLNWNHHYISWSGFLWAHLQNWEKCLLLVSCLFVCPHGTKRLPLDGFSWNLLFDYFWKICRERSSFMKIWQE